MRSRTAQWFVCTMKYEKVQEDGLQKKVTEQYVVDAMSFSEAEARIMEEMKSFISGEFGIANINPAPFNEVFFADDGGAEVFDRWYKAKLQFIAIDPKTEKEKRSNVNYLVQAVSLECARKNIDEVMSTSMIGYTISALNETNIVDVFEYGKK